MPTPFQNEAFTDFTKPENVEKIKTALANEKKNYGKTYPLVIGGKPVTTEKLLPSFNPSAPTTIIGQMSQAGKIHAEHAMTAALQAFESWKLTSPATRADYLFKAATLMRERKAEFSAALILEVGKNYAEADGDVAEAIDFLEYYAREMLRYAEPQPIVKIPGEANELFYIPLGVGIVIPPWNFALAILVGMTSAAIVTGNTVILKPSSESPIIGYKFYKLMEEVGLPEGVFNFLPGSGSEIGDFLVDHPKTRFISFTGSKAVGLSIVERAAKTHPTQLWIKRVVAEMGGKDAIVVDKDVDLESVATGIVSAAFGFQGQKCSACSRVIAHTDVYETLIEKVVEKAKHLTVGNAEDNPSMGPVISAKAFASIMDYIDIGKREGKLVHGGTAVKNGEWFITPTIFKDVAPNARISCEEIFGPVVAFIRADHFKEAIEIANNTEYGLTGAAYSNNEDHLEYARTHFHAGNLYLNRKCTGALVGVHPFGGFNMSGTDSKAGGRDYLGLFMQAKMVSRKI